MNIPPILSNLLVPLLVAVVAAWVTVKLALRRFRTERWWELKAETYMEIMDALFVLDRYWREKLREALTGEELTEDELEDLIEELNDAAYELDRVTCQGSFIIDQKAVDLLKDLDRKLKTREPPKALEKLFQPKKRYDYFKRQRSDIRKTIEGLRNMAKIELRVKD